MRYGEEDRQSTNVEDRRGQGGGGMFPRGPPAWRRHSHSDRRGRPEHHLAPRHRRHLPDAGHQPAGAAERRARACRGCRTFRAPVRGSGSPFEIPGGQQPRAAPQNDEMSRFVRRVLADTEDVWERVFQAAGKRYEKPTLVLFTRRHADGMRHGPVGDGSVLLPARPQGLHRPRVLSRAEGPLPGARRLRAGLRDRPRGRTPRAELARRRQQGAEPQATGDAARRRARGQPAAGAHGAAGRLPGGRVDERRP